MSRHIAIAFVAVAAATSLVAGAGAGSTSPPGQQAPVSVSPPSISGEALVGSTLTASTGTWSGKASKYAYQWLRCDSSGASCGAIAGEVASSYTPLSAVAGATLRVLVTATNRNGSAAATSAATSPVASAPTAPPPPPPPPPPPATPPSLSSAPTITGTAQQGQTLSASTGSWSGTAPIVYAYQWQRCDSTGVSCVPVSGATSGSFLLGLADVDRTMRVSVTASNSTGSATAASGATAVITAVQSPGAPLPNPLFAAAFEAGICPPWGHCDDYSGQGIIRRVTAPVAQGSYALEETVTPTSHASAASGSDAVWVYNNANAYEGNNGQTNTYHVAVRFPSASYKPTTGNFNWFIEHHNDGGRTAFSCQREDAEISWDVQTDYPVDQTKVGTNPRLKLRVMGGDTCAPTTTWHDFGPLQLDHWYDLRYEVKWGSTSNALVNVYIDGALAWAYSGPTLFQRPDGSYDHTNFELVNYRLHVNWNSTIYFDDVWVG